MYNSKLNQFLHRVASSHPTSDKEISEISSDISSIKASLKSLDSGLHKAKASNSRFFDEVSQRKRAFSGVDTYLAIMSL